MAALFCTVPVIAQETFTIIDLGTLGGSVSFAYGVNDQGDAVGDSSLLGDFSSHAFLWREGKMIDLGTLTDAHDISIAFAINNSGQVVGQSFNSAVGNTLPFVWENGVMTALPLLPGHLGGAAFGINSHGDVVGQSGGEAVLWVNGVVTRLTSGYSASTAYGINDRSQIVGVANPPDTEAVIWENGVMTPLSPPVLEGCHGDCWTVARAINELGDISGYVQGMRDPPARAVRWTNGIPTVLDALLERDSLIHLGSIDEVGVLSELPTALCRWTGWSQRYGRPGCHTRCLHCIQATTRGRQSVLVIADISLREHSSPSPRTTCMRYSGRRQRLLAT